MANVSTIRPQLAVTPLNYPEMPQPGKLTLLWDENKKAIYNKLSPYGSDTFLGIKTRQPFVWKTPEKGTGNIDKYAVREFPFTRAITDVQRVTKWMISGQGILWLGKQFLLQTGNAFNETRIYNPASPILGAAMPLSLWAFRPQRNIDISGGIGSIVASFLGPNVGSIFSTRTAPPPGTLGGALPTNNLNAGKGLLRAGTAQDALTNLETRWAGPSTGAGLGIGKFLSNKIKGLFGNFIPKRQLGVSKRSDEGAYGLMLGSFSGENGAFTYQQVYGRADGVQQFWFAGESGGIRKKGQVPLNWKKLFVDEWGHPYPKKPDGSERIPGLFGPVGYSPSIQSIAMRYGDWVGVSKNDDWEASDMLIQHSLYSDDGRRFPSKLTYEQNPSVIKMKDSLNRVLSSLREAGTYTVQPPADSSILSSGNASKIGYDRLVAMKKPGDSDMVYGVLKEYENSRVLENQHTKDITHRSLKMASTRQFDAINTLTVLDGDRQIKKADRALSEWTEWNPHKDDLIAFYFYDVVNDKYIPFRATVKGIQETVSVNWEEFAFIGRADKLYSYGGFTRTLAFNFTVVINSIVEMSPTWQRLNYLMGLTKPSGFTVRTQPTNRSDLYTRYMIPPMVMLTIGDLYTKQPMIIASMGFSVPENAVWETLNETNSPEGWSYLAGYIKAPKVGMKFGQLPKAVDISLSGYLLEKERAVVGSAHFGHAPHTEDYIKDTFHDTPSELHKSMVVYTEPKNSVDLSRVGDFVEPSERVQNTA